MVFLQLLRKSYEGILPDNLFSGKLERLFFSATLLHSLENNFCYRIVMILTEKIFVEAMSSNHKSS